ncbi:single-stranded-DNA-specific exonuclease RecJ [Agathobaculum sp.]|uniref:single-stranded-DNA-specific exonuclease RecJ n=1 Tax=Agathobaculum sp. TaxID=2048138 RepID=UPI002A834326|nr:single-stranded-DNA-specific exonuclease RecJ [Agathobaculum sp.]MDY3617889.1 single-stranded-DNA-specific exonuclease RecJ [Agathobaculum sp.]
MKTKRWVVAAPDRERVRALTQQGGFAPLTAAVLAARGIDTPEAAADYLSCETSGLHDPMLLADMDRAVAVIRGALQREERIVVYGDYDVDGITATCILVRYLRSVGAVCDYYIPNRLSEGYGLTRESMTELYEKGTRLLITVDSGITANEEIDIARALGMRVVVTDHHECHDTLPAADAVVDYKRPGCSYPFCHLAGVGVAFKLVCALSGDAEGMLKQYADLIALGTVADVMPIVGENRVIVAAGLRRMAETSNLGLEMLLREAGMKNRRLTSSTISFVLAPRINAAGRMGKAELAAELFLTDAAVRAQELAAELCEQNKLRQNEENQILEQALLRLRAEYNPMEDRIIVLAGENWHHGVIGIVCSRLCDRYGCPVVLIALDEHTGKGSGRSVKGFNLFEALASCEDLLEKYGGHELAAGLTVSRGQVETLRARLKAYAEDRVDAADIQPQLHIDCAIEPAWITEQNIESLSVLEPYGMQNAEPVFCMKDMTVEEITPISSDRHVRLTLSKGGSRWTAMLFGTGVGGCGFVEGNTVDAAFHLEINEFRSRRTVQLTLCDVRLSECENLADQKLLNLYNTYMADGPLTAPEARVLLPDRADLVAVWRHVVCRAEDGRLTVPSNALSRRIAWESRRSINIGKLFVCLDVFSESQLISYHFKEGMLNIILKHYEGKADISGSVVLATLQSMAG